MNAIAPPSRCHPRRRGQDGVALITVLAVIAFTSLVIGGLFGLLATTMRITAETERSAREARAADAAVDTVVNQMRSEPCDPTDQPYLGEQLFDQGTAAGGDDVTVSVSCRSAGESSGGGTDQVRIIGTDGYQGELKWTTDCAADAAASGCLAWSGALGSTPSAQMLTDSRTSLIHGGPDALQFASGVSVRTGAAGVRNPAADPAFRVGGDYRQGAPGLLSSSPTDCGLLAGDPGGGAGRVADADDLPVCGDATVKGLLGDPTGNLSGLVAPLGPPVPGVPTTCAGPVVTFTPATYNTLQTAAVSKLTDGSIPECRNKTFHFSPGVYAFEGTRLVFGDAQSYYVFGAPTSWAPSAGVAADPSVAAQPDAQLCNPTAPGSSLVINGWTELRHTAGRVAICPARPLAGDGTPLDPHPAIYQQTAVPTGVDLTINRSLPGNPITLPFRCRPLQLFTTYPTTSDFTSFGQCRPVRKYELQLQTAGQAPLTSLRVMLTGSESDETPNNLLTRRQTRFFVRSNSQIFCQTNWVSGIPNGGLTSSFDLMELPGNCNDVGLTQANLNGNRIVVEHQMDIDAVLLNPSQLLTINDAEVEINAVSGLAGTVSTTDWNNADAMKTPGAPAASPVMPNGCTDLLCPYPDPGRTIVNVNPHRFVHEVELTDFEFPGLFSSGNPELDPSITTLRAAVKMVPSNATLPAGWSQLLKVDNFLIPTESQLELRSPSGARCISQAGGVNSDQEVSFNLLDINLDTPGAPNCNNFMFENASQLDDVTLKLRFSMPCVPNHFNNIPWECQRGDLGFYDPADTSPIWQLRPPDIEHVRLTTVTDTYSGPPPNSRVTVDTTAAAAGAAFNVYGESWLPLTDLDLHWNGAAGSTPLFGDNLVLHGLASRMAADATMGVVCCSPPDSRTVELVATIDGVERLVVTVDFVDVIDDGAGNQTYSPGHAVDVLDYRTCGRGGCSAVLGNDLTNPAVVESPP